jgi:uncharacterized protein YndB with AHSA1/START domain
MEINADAPVITRDEILIKAPLTKVWNMFTNIKHWPRWNKDITDASAPPTLAVGKPFRWSTAGMNITSTIGELIPEQRIGWSGPVQGILGIHVWSFLLVEDGVLVKTAESREGEPVLSQKQNLQLALDKSIRFWLESLKAAVESHI